MRYETHIALRYLRSRRHFGFVTLISLISISGITIGVAALIIANMGAMQCFDHLAVHAARRLALRRSARFSTSRRVVRYSRTDSSIACCSSP